MIKNLKLIKKRNIKRSSMELDDFNITLNRYQIKTSKLDEDTISRLWDEFREFKIEADEEDIKNFLN